jgi:flagellar protein FliS
MNNKSDYQQVNVMTASPMELIMMLYDECIKSLRKAEQAFDIDGPERIEAINNTLLHAQDIITELAVSLDMEQGGEVAQNLQRLYEFMVSHLSRANIDKNRAAIREVRKMMEELREAWQEVNKHEDPRQQQVKPNSLSTINIAG